MGARRSRPRILEAALRLASGEQQGPLTMEAIALCAGVTRRTLYNHFANVGELCMAACAPLFEHCRSALPQGRLERRSARLQMHGFATEVIGFQRDPVHVSLKRTTELQSLSAPELRRAYRRQIGEPLRRVVADRLSVPLDATPSESLVDEVLATLEAVNRLDYLVRDLTQACTASVVVDMLLDRIGLQDQLRRAA